MVEMLNGVDFAHWQKVIDWADMKAQKDAGKLDFVIFRAGSINNISGVCYEDYQFRANLQGAKSTGIPYAAYFYMRPNHDPLKQADFFVSLMHGNYCAATSVDMWCDIEVEGVASQVAAFCDRVSQYASTGIYANANALLYLLKGDKTPLAKYPLWLADWTQPYPVPAPFKTWLVLQYGKRPDAGAYGCPSDVKEIDHDYALPAFLTTTPPEPTPEPVPQPTLQIPSVWFVPNGGACVIQHAAKWYKTGTGIDKPLFAPVGEGTHPKITSKAKVFPIPVTGDGGTTCYMLLDRIINGETVYVRRQDGVIKP